MFTMNSRKQLIINVNADDGGNDDIGGDCIVLLTEINDFKETIGY